MRNLHVSVKSLHYPRPAGPQAKPGGVVCLHPATRGLVVEFRRVHTSSATTDCPGKGLPCAHPAASKIPRQVRKLAHGMCSRSGVQFTHHRKITANTPLGAGMPCSPPYSSDSVMAPYVTTQVIIKGAFLPPGRLGVNLRRPPDPYRIGPLHCGTEYPTAAQQTYGDNFRGRHSGPNRSD